LKAKQKDREEKGRQINLAKTEAKKAKETISMEVLLEAERLDE
jgi:hypothetical protein